MEGLIKGDRQFNPAQLLVVSFLVAILVGTGLLTLPWSTEEGGITLIDAFFTSTSAVCVTGLIVRDTPTCFTPFGQVVLLVLLQLGGLGIMTFSTLVLLVAGRKISITERLLVEGEFHHSGSKNMTSLIRNIFLYTFAIEGIGAVLFFVRWGGSWKPGRVFFLSLFHSISAFCNAGFSLFSDSFESFRGDPWLNGILILLIILGGLGFLVLHECGTFFLTRVNGKKHHFSLHARMVLSLTLILILVSFFVFLVSEWNVSLKSYGTGEKILTALFQGVTTRTAGFNTINMNTVGTATTGLLIFLMFVGASPGSTGGGIKTSTIGVLLAFLRSKLNARESVHAFRRTLPTSLVLKAFTVLTLSVVFIFLSAFLLLSVEPELSMRMVFFEVFSAFGTVGLSMGLTPHLGTAGKIILIVTMYVGRIGPMALLYAFSRRRPYGKFEYVEESVMIG